MNKKVDGVGLQFVATILTSSSEINDRITIGDVWNEGATILTSSSEIKGRVLPTVL